MSEYARRKVIKKLWEFFKFDLSFGTSMAPRQPTEPIRRTIGQSAINLEKLYPKWNWDPDATKSARICDKGSIE